MTAPTVRGQNVPLIAAMNTQGVVWHEVIAHSMVTSNIFGEISSDIIAEIR